MAAADALSPVPVLIGRFEDLVGLGLHALLSSDPAIDVVAQDVDPHRLPSVVAEHRPRVVLVSLESLQSPVEIRELHARFPDTRVVVLANAPTSVQSTQLLGFGAAACLSKETQARDILTAIHLASRGLHVLPQRQGAAPSAGPDLLTLREAEVLALLQDGRSNGEIAAGLHVGVETVRTHVRNIFRKLGVSSRRELAAGAAAGRPGRRSLR